MSIVYWPNAEYKTTKTVTNAAIVSGKKVKFSPIGQNASTGEVVYLFPGIDDLVFSGFPVLSFKFLASNWYMGGVEYVPGGWELVFSSVPEPLIFRSLSHVTKAFLDGKNLLNSPFNLPLSSSFDYVVLRFLSFGGGEYYALIGRTTLGAPFSINQVSLFIPSINFFFFSQVFASSSVSPPPSPSPTKAFLCWIAINYTDNTTETIYPGYCPDWVKWRSDQDCPENTCKCDCGDHYCCFDANGNPVLEIPKI